MYEEDKDEPGMSSNAWGSQGVAYSNARKDTTETKGSRIKDMKKDAMNVGGVFEIYAKEDDLDTYD